MTYEGFIHLPGGCSPVKLLAFTSLSLASHTVWPQLRREVTLTLKQPWWNTCASSQGTVGVFKDVIPIQGDVPGLSHFWFDILGHTPSPHHSLLVSFWLSPPSLSFVIILASRLKNEVSCGQPLTNINSQGTSLGYEWVRYFHDT